MARDQRVGGQIDADMNAAVKHRPFRLHLLNATVDEVLLHLEVGNAVAQQAAGLCLLLVDMHVMAGARQLLRRRKSRRPGADDGDLLACFALGRLGNHPALLEAAIDDRAFDGLDGDRLVLKIQRARRFAGRRADAAGELREVVGGMEIDERAPPLAMVDEVIPVGNLIIDRTAVVAKWNAAIHAARGLAARGLVRQRNDEFAIMANAVGRRLIFAVMPVDLEKPGHLTHLIAHLSRRASRPQRHFSLARQSRARKANSLSAPRALSRRNLGCFLNAFEGSPSSREASAL